MDAGVPDLAAPLDLSVGNLAADLARAADDAAVDDAFVAVDQAPPPPDLACAPLFVGGVDPATQGWTTILQQPATLSTPSPGVTQLQTTTTSGAPSSGQLLLWRSAAIMTGKAFTIDFVVKVIAVSPHNQYDSATALMGSLTPSAGTQTDRGEMIYIDGDKIGWGDDTQSAAANALDGNFHTYRLAVDAAGNATVSRDSTALLSRSGYTTTGNLAFGDQTNDPNVDSTMQIQSVTLLCN
jgi:hypothetical protein